MFYTLILENESGRQLNLSETANRIMFSKIEGFSPPAGTISTSSYAGMDGSYLNNAFISWFLKKGLRIELKDVEMFTSSTCKTGSKRSGTFYAYDGNVINGRVRVTIKPEYCGNTPIGKYVTGWVNKADI